MASGTEHERVELGEVDLGVMELKDNVLLVESDGRARRRLSDWLEEAGFRVLEYDSGKGVLAEAAPAAALACVSLELTDLVAEDVIRELRARDPDLLVIVVAAHWELERALLALRTGAHDYVTKPLDRASVMLRILRAKEHRTLRCDVRRLETALGERRAEAAVVGQSEPMQELKERIRIASAHDSPVCLFGESGTGKELVARTIHQGSARSHARFLAINCVGLPDELQSAELFGHEKGAFSGAVEATPGKCELAAGGTVLIDEVGELGFAAQTELLRLLDERTLRRVGGHDAIAIDIRVIAATHTDLRELVARGTFREDLCARLLGCLIRTPSLRQAHDDIPRLVRYFLDKLQEDTDTRVRRVSPEALDALSQHRWPGNMRELKNVVHRSLLACRGDEITLADLSPDVRQAVESRANGRGKGPQGTNGNDVVPLREVEKQAIEHALRHTQGSVGQAAKLLGIGRATLYRRIASLELTLDFAQ